MRGVLVDEDQTVAGLGDDIGAVQLSPGDAEREVDGVGGLGCRVWGVGCGEVRLDAGGTVVEAGDGLGGGSRR